MKEFCQIKRLSEIFRIITNPQNSSKLHWWGYHLNAFLQPSKNSIWIWSSELYCKYEPWNFFVLDFLQIISTFWVREHINIFQTHHSGRVVQQWLLAKVFFYRLYEQRSRNLFCFSMGNPPLFYKRRLQSTIS